MDFISSVHSVLWSSRDDPWKRLAHANQAKARKRRSFFLKPADDVIGFKFIYY